MKTGSEVITVSSFEDLRQVWGFNYPCVGDVLSVSGVFPRWDGLWLKFVEKPELVPLAHIQHDGTPNFIEVLRHTFREGSLRQRIMDEGTYITEVTADDFREMMRLLAANSENP